MNDHERALEHYTGVLNELQWETEHFDGITELFLRADVPLLSQALSENVTPENRKKILQALELCDWAEFGRLMGPAVKGYLWNDAVDRYVPELIES